MEVNIITYTYNDLSNDSHNDEIPDAGFRTKMLSSITMSRVRKTYAAGFWVTHICM